MLAVMNMVTLSLNCDLLCSEIKNPKISWWGALFWSDDETFLAVRCRIKNGLKWSKIWGGWFSGDGDKCGGGGDDVVF